VTCLQVQEEGIDWLQRELCLQQEVTDFIGPYVRKEIKECLQFVVD
jgi:hypothetical protein